MLRNERATKQTQQMQKHKERQNSECMAGDMKKRRSRRREKEREKRELKLEKAKKNPQKEGNEQ